MPSVYSGQVASVKLVLENVTYEFPCRGLVFEVKHSFHEELEYCTGPSELIVRGYLTGDGKVTKNGKVTTVPADSVARRVVHVDKGE